MDLYGIDGCKGGWLIATITQTNVSRVSFSVAPRIAEFFAKLVDRPAIVVIDIPIGLSEDSFRDCDKQARALLGSPRSRSVFSAPCRCCLGTMTYAEACQRNFTARGRKLSQQCYAILRKIDEVDASMSSERQRFVREAHPEVTFAVLAGLAMSNPKRTKEGVGERLEILRAHGLALTFDQIQEYRRELGRGKELCIPVSRGWKRGVLLVADPAILSFAGRIAKSGRVVLDWSS
jgi:predicted RNase H-like nuclease